jgi:hypothetical protein
MSDMTIYKLIVHFRKNYDMTLVSAIEKFLRAEFFQMADLVMMARGCTRRRS